MQRPSLPAMLRRIVLTLLIVAVAAGCATPAPDESVAPDDASTDRDRNGIPDAEEQGPGPFVDNQSAANETIPILTPSPMFNETSV